MRMFNLSIDSSTFIGNLAQSLPLQIGSGMTQALNPAFANGGAILLRGSAAASVDGQDSLTALVSNCNFTSNLASGGGSAVFIESGSTLQLSRSVLSNNVGFIAAILCQGVAKIESSLFANNSAAVVASDFFLSCVSSTCQVVVSASTFVLLEDSENVKQFLRNQNVFGKFQSLSSCVIRSFICQGGLFAPKISLKKDSRFFDFRNANRACKSLSLSIMNADSEISSDIPDPDFSCAAGSVPTCSAGLSAVFPTTLLATLSTALYMFPLFQSQTALIPIRKGECSCQPCPPNTFQGTNMLPYQSFKAGSPFAEASVFFCRPCPFGGICSDPSILRVTPGFYLWQTNNASNFNVAVAAEKLAPGYGFELESG